MSQLIRWVFWLAVVVAVQPVVLYGEEQRCSRIVSLAPSITEVLFDLGLGDRVVGVTRFCRFPVGAQAIESVGGMYDLSVERIAIRRPTNLFALPESSHVAEPLARIGVKTTALEHRGVGGILDSYRVIGRECGVEAQAEARVAQLQAEEREIQAKCASFRHERPTNSRVMVVVGRAKLGNVSSDIYISGSDGFYSDVLRLVGAINVNSDRTVAVPHISAEGILSLNPDVILEVINADDGDTSMDRRSFWSRFARIPAVVNNRVFILEDDFASIPGPRYILLAKKLSSLLCGA